MESLLAYIDTLTEKRNALITQCICTLIKQAGVKLPEDPTLETVAQVKRDLESQGFQIKQYLFSGRPEQERITLETLDDKILAGYTITNVFDGVSKFTTHAEPFIGEPPK